MAFALLGNSSLQKWGIPVCNFGDFYFAGKTFDEHYGKDEAKLIGELAKIRLHNPEKVGEILKDNKRSVTMYGFPDIVSRCLKTSGIHTVDQLIERTEGDLRRIRNLGLKRIREIEEILSRHGYSLRQD